MIIWFLCFRFDALAGLGAFVRTEFLCVSVLRVASGLRVRLASCKGALTPPPPTGGLWSENQADIIEAFNSTSRYLDDLLNIDNIYFDQMVDRIYPTELQLNRANSSDTEAPFLDLNLCI